MNKKVLKLMEDLGGTWRPVIGLKDKIGLISFEGLYFVNDTNPVIINHKGEIEKPKTCDKYERKGVMVTRPYYILTDKNGKKYRIYRNRIVLPSFNQNYQQGDDVIHINKTLDENGFYDDSLYNLMYATKNKINQINKENNIRAGVRGAKAQKELKQMYENLADLPNEIWKPADKVFSKHGGELYPSQYQVSNLGRIKDDINKKMVNTHDFKFRPKVTIRRNPQDNLGRTIEVSLANVVATQFVEGWTREKCHIIYLNGDKSDCRACNLIWGTIEDRDKYRIAKEAI